jgi:hypothetical protein
LGNHIFRGPGRFAVAISPAVHSATNQKRDIRTKARATVVNKLEKMLAEARTKRTWGEITITLKDGKPVLLKQTTQEKAEDEEYPASNDRTS